MFNVEPRTLNLERRTFFRGLSMDFIDLKTQQQRIKAQLDANIQKVLAHGNYIIHHGAGGERT